MHHVRESIHYLVEEGLKLTRIYTDKTNGLSDTNSYKMDEKS